MITMKDIGASLARNVHGDMNSRTIDNKANLAKAVMERALQFANEVKPGAEICALRAVTTPKGVELFRYDLDPQIARD